LKKLTDMEKYLFTQIIEKKKKRFFFYNFQSKSTLNLIFNGKIGQYNKY